MVNVIFFSHTKKKEITKVRDGIKKMLQYSDVKYKAVSRDACDAVMREGSGGRRNHPVLRTPLQC